MSYSNKIAGQLPEQILSSSVNCAYKVKWTDEHQSDDNRVVISKRATRLNHLKIFISLRYHNIHVEELSGALLVAVSST